MSVVCIMPRSVAKAGIGVHVNVHGSCCQPGRPWSVLLLVKDKEATFEVVSMNADLGLRKGIIGFIDKPYTLTHPFPPQKEHYR